MTKNTVFSKALESYGVQCQVVEIDYIRSLSGFGAVDTNYIIQIRPTAKCICPFKTFSIEKTYHDFRTIVADFKKASKDAVDKVKSKGTAGQAGWLGVPESTQNLIAFADAFAHVIGSTPNTNYIYKMNFTNVEDMAKERRKTLDKALTVLTENYPDSRSEETQPVSEFKRIVHEFFLTDHVYEEPEIDGGTPKALAAGTSLPSVPKKKISNTANTTRSTNVAIETQGVEVTSTTATHVPINKHEMAPNNAVSTPNTNSPIGNTRTQHSPKMTSSPKPQSPNDVRVTDAKNSTTPTHATFIGTTTNQAAREEQIVPRSIKKRKSTNSRKEMEMELMVEGTKNRLTFNDNYPINGEECEVILAEEPTLWDSPLSVFGLLFVLAFFFSLIPQITIEVDLDAVLFLFFGSFVAGTSFGPKFLRQDMEDVDAYQYHSQHHHHHHQSSHKNRPRVDSETLMKKSLGGNMDNISRPKEARKKSNCSMTMSISNNFRACVSNIVSSTVDEDNNANDYTSLQKFPDGAEIGSILNSWSEPVYSEFRVRGANYLKDRKKIPSNPFLFPIRGADLLLSDNCPEHIARYKAILGSKLREKATFLINYRLPWGNFVVYNEIPSKFLPFLRHCYDKRVKVPSMKDMNPAEICACRFLMADNTEKDKVLKIIPKVVKGPWIVKKTVDGKPAIVGTKMPTQFFYEPPSEGKAEYFEIDLDIVASSAARGILAVAQRYTKSLTLDLGFVLQGNSEDELPEQMLMGARIHGLDPLTAPMLPQSIDGML